MIRWIGTDGTNQHKVFKVLKDLKPHCRFHSYVRKGISTAQIAGGGGLGGLKRMGYVMKSDRRYCSRCGRSTAWDRLTGKIRRRSAVGGGVPRQLQLRILEHYDYTDAIELRRRPEQNLTIDHRFPRKRWGSYSPPSDSNMSDKEIEKHFQLLKKDRAGNHNLLKSRACEHCFRTGERGAPMGLRFWYRGGPNWPRDVPTKGETAIRGCTGCGWFNVTRWREALNEQLQAN
jgi:hypothetical protein